MLTDSQVRSAKPSERPRKLFDGRGLYLYLTPNGGRYWRFNYQFNGSGSEFCWRVNKPSDIQGVHGPRLKSEVPSARMTYSNSSSSCSLPRPSSLIDTILVAA
jgi:hypothetical protein